MSRILIADPNKDTRSALNLLISHKLEFASTDIVEVDDVESLIRALSDSSFELLLLDVQLYGAPALETCNLLQKAYPELKIILLSVDTENGTTAKSAGVAFVHKGTSPGSVIKLLKTLLKNDQ
jgi:DNA-binding NarL/FixJ family response regulator